MRITLSNWHRSCNERLHLSEVFGINASPSQHTRMHTVSSIACQLELQDGIFRYVHSNLLVLPQHCNL